MCPLSFSPSLTPHSLSLSLSLFLLSRPLFPFLSLLLSLNLYLSHHLSPSFFSFFLSLQLKFLSLPSSLSFSLFHHHHLSLSLYPSYCLSHSLVIYLILHFSPSLYASQGRFSLSFSSSLLLFPSLFFVLLLILLNISEI